MKIDSRIGVAQRAIDLKDWKLAGQALTAAMDCPEDMRHRLLPLLTTVSEHDDLATHTLAVLLTNDIGVEVDLDRGRALFEKLTRSSDREFSSIGHTAMGSFWSGYFGTEPDHAKSLHHWETSAGLGSTEGAFNAGYSHASGAAGTVDDVKAEKYYRMAIDGGDGPAMMNLAVLILEGRAPGGFKEGIRLLEHAALDGDRNSQVIVDALGGMDNEDEKLVPALLKSLSDNQTHANRVSMYWKPGDAPVRVVPAGRKRAQLVAEAIAFEFDVPENIARKTAAALYGFQSWPDLVEAAKTAPDPVDEKVKAAELGRRREFQTFTLKTSLEIDEHEAEMAIRLLAPTSGEGRPSLKGLDDALEHTLFPGSTQELAGAFGEVMKNAGIEGDPLEFMENIRLMGPMSPEAWIDVLEGKLGWKLHDKRPDAQGHGAQIANVIRADGEKWPLFISPVMYNPGDNGDRHVEQLTEEIAGKHRQAVLIFAKTFVLGDEDKKAIYGGRILSDGQWNDFCYNPNGFDAVVTNRRRFDDEAYLAECHLPEAFEILDGIMKAQTAEFRLPGLGG